MASIAGHPTKAGTTAGPAGNVGQRSEAALAVSRLKSRQDVVGAALAGTPLCGAAVVVAIVFLQLAAGSQAALAAAAPAQHHSRLIGSVQPLLLYVVLCWEVKGLQEL